MSGGGRERFKAKLVSALPSQIKITTLSDLNFSFFSRSGVLDEIFNLIDANKSIKSKRELLAQ